MRHVERCYDRCGRFAPKSKPMGTIFTPDFPAGAPLLAAEYCGPCKRRHALANKRRAVLARNLVKAYGD